ncbi:MAG: hypothetical protein EP343_16925 [Deltaproteobacteria bacterium]|nr:MAG: hypothetical protein EP343_16925 [Deltaproteobacteria bacterium]
MHTLTYGALGGLACCVAALLGWRIRSRSAQLHQSIYLSPWFFLFAAAWLFTLLQLVPLPPGLLSTFAPETYKVFQNTLGAVGLLDAGSWQALSLAPPETAGKLARDTAFLVAFLVLLQWAHQRARVRLLMSFSIMSALSLCGLVSFQTLVGIERPLLGLAKVQSTNPSLFLGNPFLNPEHFSSFLLFNTLLTLPLFINNIHTRERLGWATAFGILFVFLLLSMSVTSVVLCCLGVLMFLGFLGKRLFAEQEDDPTQIDPAYAPLPFLNISPATAQPLSQDGAIKQYPSSQRAQEVEAEAASEPPKKRRLFKKNYQRSSRDPKPVWKGWKFIWQRPILRVVFAVAVLMLGYVVASGVQSTIYRLSPSSKLAHTASFADSLSMTTTLTSHYPLWGTGRGATPLAWPRFASLKGPYQGKKTVTHVESFWLQPLADWGLLGVVFLLAFLGLLGLTLMRCRGMLERGLWIALTVLFLDNIGSFGLAHLGVGIPFAMFLGSLVRLQYNRDEEVRRYSLNSYLGILGVAFLSLAFCIPYARKYPYTNSAGHWLGVKAAKPQQRKAALQRLLKHYPSDYLVASHLTEFYARSNPWKPKEAIAWSERGLFLNPTAPALHLYRGYVFARLTQSKQAVESLSQAVLYQPKLLKKAAQVAVQFQLEREILHSSKSVPLLAQVLKVSPKCQKQPTVCLTWTAGAHKRFPKEFLLYREQAFLQWKQLRAALQDDDDDNVQAWKNKLQSTLKALQNRLPKAHPNFESLLKGFLAEASADVASAREHYNRVIQSNNCFQWDAFQAQYHLLAKRGKTGALQKLFERVRHSFRQPKRAALVAYREAIMLRLMGKLQESLVRFGSATQLDPQNKYWLGMANVCKQLKQYRCTVRIYNRLVKQKQFEYLKPEIKRLKPFTLVQ